MSAAPRSGQPQLPSPDMARLLLLLLFPRTLRALRDAAASLSATPFGGQDRAASRSARAPETATPGVAAPGAALPCNPEETQGMATVPHAPVAALPPPRAPLAEVGTAQHTALLRWHNHRPLYDVVDDLHAHPRFPCLSGGAE